ncbi:hypothetical protein DYB37_006699 [Aphanomyces astaci]|uniref:Uncharacterized protein n=1 Tax=Aphanomyces astaci TaxID=112090 RepID=A0A397AQW4_APHAT|nr:hypothetical protein DYB25_011303 [Aphanomyces astaci]RHY12728.1 hypothetical protein DYB36_010552 [Aphanomyces astaci]RHY42993.1 hypothetical protein DYB34_005817 [Aphanomyces astaci]RHY45690.1 hypothetical protein DYB38_011432 [Aphanomyces astaci]RHY76087.1 hypothetical protein DYB30_002302 [Aphanomyces astaci]
MPLDLIASKATATDADDGFNYVLHAVTPTQLRILRPSILKLWNFEANAAAPLSMEELMEWADAGEFAVAIRLHGTAASYCTEDEALLAVVESTNSMTSDDLVAKVVGTVRHVSVYRTKHTTELLMHIGCPSFLWDRSSRNRDGAVAQGYFHVPSKSFQPASLGQRLPRIEAGKDIVTYLSTAFVAPEVEGTGLRHHLSYGKLARNMPNYRHAARLGHRIFLTTTLYDHRTNGLKFAHPFLQLVAKLARDIGIELGLGAAISFNVVHWSVQSCWQEDATVVMACIDPMDGFDVDSSYMYTSPRASSISNLARDSSHNYTMRPRAQTHYQSTTWWNWPKRVVQSMMQSKRRGSVVDRSSRVY